MTHDIVYIVHVYYVHKNPQAATGVAKSSGIPHVNIILVAWHPMYLYGVSDNH